MPSVTSEVLLVVKTDVTARIASRRVKVSHGVRTMQTAINCSSD